MSYTRTEENCGLDFFLWVAKPRIGKNKFPTSGLAGMVKANFPQAAKPWVEEFVFNTTAKPWVEKFRRTGVRSYNGAIGLAEIEDI